MNCGGCGTLLEPTEEQVNEAVDEVLAASLADAHGSGGVCPLCGHSQATPFWNRKTVLFGLLSTCLVLFLTILLITQRISHTLRSRAIAAALSQLQQSDPAKQLLGFPLVVEAGVKGTVTHDETGWMEARLRIPVRGPKGEAMVEVVGGRDHDAWVFSSFEVVIAAQRKKIDILSGKVQFFEPGAYVDVHTQAAQRPEYLRTEAPAPQMDGTFSCVSAPIVGNSIVASLGNCGTPVGQTKRLDQFTVDLRYGAFVLQQSDLAVKGQQNVFLTRSYRSDDWLCKNNSHAFGRNSNHPYDVALLGTRNPYTYLDLVLEDGEFLRFERISKGTGYANAVYQHTETSTRFYKSTISWNGGGWSLIFADGSRMEFPESYSAANLAQGAATAIQDGNGNKLILRRDKQRNLLEIDASDHPAIRFSYDDQARIVRAEDDHGNWVIYTYSRNGLLTDVASSTRVERHYEYSGDLMTMVKDEHGHVILHNTYEDGQVVRQEYPNGQVFEYAYKMSANQLYVELATVTFPDHTSEEVRPNGIPNSIKVTMPS